mmetsp:Transcript_23473/g.39826  ORF Transcript_23473/g.39826 Transcript_23473/m.39826 type:complete len:686 (+) Transcript_23473:198-2255(+)
MIQELLHRQISIAAQPRMMRNHVMSSEALVKRFSRERTLGGHAGCVNTVLFSEDGQLAITGSDDTYIKLFDIWTGRLLHTVTTLHTNNIFYAKDVPLSGAEKLLSCAADGKVVLTYTEVQPDSGTRYSQVLHKHRGRAHRLALIPSSPEEFYSCGEDGCLLGYDLRDSHTDPRLLTTFRDNQSLRCSIYVLGVHPRKPYEVALGGGQETVKIYDIRKGGGSALSELCPPKLRDHFDEVTVTGLQYNYTGDQMVLSYNDEDIYIMDPLLHGAVADIQPDSSSAPLVDNDDEDRDHDEAHEQKEQQQTLDTADEPSSSSDVPGQVTDSDVATGYVRKFAGHRNCQTVKQITYMGSHSEWVVSGSDCGHVFIWNASNGKLVKLLQADDTGAVNCLAPHPFMPLLATSGLDDSAKLWAPSGNDSPLVSFVGPTRSADSVMGSDNYSHFSSDDEDEERHVMDEVDERRGGQEDQEAESSGREYSEDVQRINAAQRRRHAERFMVPRGRSMAMQMYLRLFHQRMQEMEDDDDDDDDDDDEVGVDALYERIRLLQREQMLSSDSESESGDSSSSSNESNSGDGDEGNSHAESNSDSSDEPSGQRSAAEQEWAVTERQSLIENVRNVAAALSRRSTPNSLSSGQDEDNNDNSRTTRRRSAEEDEEITSTDGGVARQPTGDVESVNKRRKFHRK